MKCIKMHFMMHFMTASSHPKSKADQILRSLEIHATTARQSALMNVNWENVSAFLADPIPITNPGMKERNKNAFNGASLVFMNLLNQSISLPSYWFIQEQWRRTTGCGKNAHPKYPVGLWLTIDYTFSGCWLTLNHWFLQGRKELLRRDHNTSKRRPTKIFTDTWSQNRGESKSLLINKQVYNAVVVMYNTTPLQKFRKRLLS